MLPQTAQGKERCGELPTQSTTAETLTSLNPTHSMAQTVYRRIPKNELSVGKASLSPDTAVKPTTQGEARSQVLSDFRADTYSLLMRICPLWGRSVETLETVAWRRSPGKQNVETNRA